MFKTPKKGFISKLGISMPLGDFFDNLPIQALNQFLSHLFSVTRREAAAAAEDQIYLEV